MANNTNINTITFVHYGADSFDIRKFDNNNYNTCDCKPGPHKGLWGSPVAARYDWKEFCRLECDEILEEKKFFFRVNGPLCIIDSVEDLDQLSWSTPSVPWQVFYERVNWQETSKNWAAVMVTEKFLIERSPTNPRDLSGWDCESVVVLDPMTVTPIENPESKEGLVSAKEKETNMHYVSHIHAYVRHTNEQDRLNRLANRRAEADNFTISTMGFGDSRKEEVKDSGLSIFKQPVKQERTVGLAAERKEPDMDNATLLWNSRYMDYSSVSNTNAFPIRDERLIFAETVIAAAKKKRVQKEKPWDVEKFVEKAIHRAHIQLTRCNHHTEAGLFNANRWADCIEQMVQYLDDTDRESRTMEQALTYSCSRRMKKNSEGEDTQQPIWVPSEFGRSGKVTKWKTLLKIDARVDMTTTFDHGEKCSYVAIPVPVMDDKGNRSWSTSFGSIRKVGAAELGLDDEFDPIREPWGGNQQREILHESGVNTREVADDYAPAFNVVDEEHVMRGYTYSTEAEEEWVETIRAGLEYVSSLNEIVALHDGVEKLWNAKAFRFHIYRLVHNEIVERAFSIEAIKDHEKLADWKFVGTDTKRPTHGEHILEKIESLNKELETAKLSGNKAIIKRVKNQRAKAYKSYFRFMKKAERSAGWAWNNLLAKEGMGVRRNGEPFGDSYDGVEDALQLKGARATGGTPDEIDRLIYGEYDESDEASPGQGGPQHSVASDEVSLCDEILEIDGVGPKTLELFEDAGYNSLDEINLLSLDQLVEITNNRKRAVAIWYCGAELMKNNEMTNLEIGKLAVSRFGSSRGASVDLLKPFHRETSYRPLTHKLQIQDFSVSDAEISCWENGLKTFALADWDEVPPVEGFTSVEKALDSLINL